MPVKTSDIQIKKYIALNNDKKNITVIEAKLTIINECSVLTLENKHASFSQEKHMGNQLKKSILHHIYGELIAPFNQLITISKCNAENNKQFNEIEEIILKLNNVLHGK